MKAILGAFFWAAWYVLFTFLCAFILEMNEVFSLIKRYQKFKWGQKLLVKINFKILPIVSNIRSPDFCARCVIFQCSNHHWGIWREIGASEERSQEYQIKWVNTQQKKRSVWDPKPTWSCYEWSGFLVWWPCGRWGRYENRMKERRNITEFYSR